MKNNMRILLFLFIFLSTSKTIHAYRWILNNFTSKILLTQVELLLSKNPYFVLVEPMQSADFNWPPGNVMAGFCLGKVKYLVADESLLKQADIINKKTMEVKNNKKMLAWLDKHSNAKTAQAAGLPHPYVRLEANIKLVPDELFNETVAHAKKLMGTKFGAKIVGYFANLVAKSKCRSREIAIVEQDGKIEFYAPAN